MGIGRAASIRWRMGAARGGGGAIGGTYFPPCFAKGCGSEVAIGGAGVGVTDASRTGGALGLGPLRGEALGEDLGAGCGGAPREATLDAASSGEPPLGDAPLGDAPLSDPLAGASDREAWA
jgi:hypothetical protein